MAEDEVKQPDVTAETVGEEPPPPPPEYPLYWFLTDEQDKPLDDGAGIAVYIDRELSVRAQNGPPFAVRLDQVHTLETPAERIKLRMRDGSGLMLCKIGRQYEALRDALLSDWKALARKEALVKEPELASFPHAAGMLRIDRSRVAENETVWEGPAGECRVTLCETGLDLAWDDGMVQRIPYVFAEQREEGYRFHFSLPDGSVWIVAKLGRDTDRFRETLQQAMNTLKTRALDLIKTLDRTLTPIMSRQLAMCFLDGRAASRQEVETVSPALWSAMEKKLDAVGIGTSLKAVAGRADGRNIRIGIKRGLVGGDQGDYLWFFAPLWQNGKGCIVMEASSEGSGGRATYVFRIPGSSQDTAEQAEHTVKAMDELNYGLYMVNFRREPIYLSEEQLQKPANELYRRSVERLPALRHLRDRYVGRVAHTDAWEKSLNALLDRATEG